MTNQTLDLTAEEAAQWADTGETGQRARLRARDRARRIGGPWQTVEILDADGTVLDALVCEDYS